MSWAHKRIDWITLFSADLERSKAFYQDVLDLPVIYEDENSAVFKLENTGINLLRTSEAYDLVAPASVAAPDSGSRALFTIDVDDVDAVCAELAARGVALVNGPLRRSWRPSVGGRPGPALLRRGTWREAQHEAALPERLDRPGVVVLADECHRPTGGHAVEDREARQGGPRAAPASGAGDLDPVRLRASPRLAQGGPDVLAG
jgi:lactoylglutathione lyase